MWFGEVCSCCCVLLPPQLSQNILATTYKNYFRAQYMRPPRPLRKSRSNFSISPYISFDRLEYRRLGKAVAGREMAVSSASREHQSTKKGAKRFNSPIAFSAFVPNISRPEDADLHVSGYYFETNFFHFASLNFCSYTE